LIQQGEGEKHGELTLSKDQQHKEVAPMLKVKEEETNPF